MMRFSPRALMGDILPKVHRPHMLAIVASVDLARALLEGPDEPPDGFVIEGPTAGGHNAPPRGPLLLDDAGQPIYGSRDEVDLAELRSLGLPFWLAGSYGTAEGLRRALGERGAGIQVGTAFAFCTESGIEKELKARVLAKALRGDIRVRTDPRVSPSGFPFKVVELEGSLSDERVFASRPKVCDVGCLRVPFTTPGGSIGYRCPAEPDAVYARKGGRPQNAAGRKCLCNGLLATIGLGQRRGKSYDEPPIVTSGDDLMRLSALVPGAGGAYSALDVLREILGPG
jgi:NAD(P)H-dependent flavin oxidoreductase YrpB (nitropropane dioxygenase family)